LVLPSGRNNNGESGDQGENMKSKNNNNGSTFEKFASRITHAVGTNTAFFLASISVILWLVTGPIFGFSDTWQLVINTGTTIVTFLMVFLIQKTQNKDSIAIQIKLNELVASNSKASNRLVSVEEMTEDELMVLSSYYSKLATMAKKDENLRKSHSIDEAEVHHEEKQKKIKKSHRRANDVNR
jgi:low affinity Fe/Cu permease